MKKLSALKIAFTKALTHLSVIIGTIAITVYIIIYYDLIDTPYTFPILAISPAILSLITLKAINYWESNKTENLIKLKWFWAKICKTFYAIPMTGIALFLIMISKNDMPHPIIGFTLLIGTIGLFFDYLINPNDSLFLSFWDIITDLILSIIAGYLTTLNWGTYNTIIILIIIYTLIIHISLSDKDKPKG